MPPSELRLCPGSAWLFLYQIGNIAVLIYFPTGVTMLEAFLYAQGYLGAEGTAIATLEDFICREQR
ncbi:hypothetical protein QJ48_21735 [Paenibacillus sp. A3]|nr:hypothetical protein QJ48_21735 [Paenibacillus sp. A3]